MPFPPSVKEPASCLIHGSSWAWDLQVREWQAKLRSEGRELDRQIRRLLPVEIEYVGQVIADEHVIGYGLDLDERYRNLPGLQVADEAELRAEPTAMFERLVRR